MMSLAGALRVCLLLYVPHIEQFTTSSGTGTVTETETETVEANG